MKTLKARYLCLAVLLVAIRAQAQANENPRWNATPDDINNLLKSLKQLIDVNYQMEIKSLGELDVNPENNPIVYYSGHYNFSFSDDQRTKLRKYMLDGGMMIFNAGLGSAPFYRSAKKELAQIFPEVQLQRLSSDHPLFHAYYDVERVEYSDGVAKSGFRGQEPWIDGVTMNCRTVAIVSRFGLAVGWDGGEVHPEYAAYMSESAQKIGVNILSYATALRGWANESSTALQFVDSGKSSVGMLGIVQVVYEGEWKTRHAGMSILLKTFNSKTDVPVKFVLKEKKLSDPTLFDAPMLYFTGHENFRLNKSEAARLREYLLNGGFVFAEACCGRKGFELSFRQQLSRILPEHPMREIPGDNMIYAFPNNVSNVGVTPALAAQTGSSIRPKLMGIEINGYYGVVFSPYGMAGGWEMSQSPYAHGYNASGSLLLGQNILMYAITQ